jgi:hypothetical protein
MNWPNAIRKQKSELILPEKVVLFQTQHSLLLFQKEEATRSLSFVIEGVFGRMDSPVFGD